MYIIYIKVTEYFLPRNEKYQVADSITQRYWQRIIYCE